MSRLIIFGERPGPNTDPSQPLYPHTSTGAAARLISLMGVTTQWFLEERNVVRYNVWDDLVSSELNTARARVWQRMLHHLEHDGLPLFLFLGGKASHAGPVRVRNMPWCVIGEDALVVPHPSGRNRWYNSLANTHLAKQSLREFVEILRSRQGV